MLIKNKVILLVSVFVLLLTACGKDKTTPGADNKIKQEINTFLTGEPKTLDPSLSTDTYSGDILINISEGLTRMTSDDKGQDHISGAGAEFWEVSDDGITWTFHLRDYHWEDGKKVTAEDYVYGITRSLSPETGSPYSYLLYPIKNAASYNKGKVSPEELGIKALDENTLEIILERRTPYFLELTYSALMLPERRDIVEKHGSLYGSGADYTISNGPFKVDQWEHEQKVVLSKNDTYWDSSSVSLENINFFITRDENVRMDMLFKGEAQVGEASKQEWADKFISSGRFYEYPGYSAGTNYIFFNGEKGIFSNENVRKAFSLGIDREEMSKTIYRGLFEPAYAWVAPGIDVDGVDFRETAGTNTPDNTRTPREYLIEGLRELGIDKAPEEITVTYLNPSTTNWARSYSEFLAAMYKESLGINVRSEFLSWPVFEERVAERDYEFGGMAWFADYNDPSSFLEIFADHSELSPVSWENTRYDTLLSKAATSEENQERMALLLSAEKLLLEKGWITPTVYIKRRIFISNEVREYFLTPFTSPDYKNVYLEAGE